MVLPPKRGWTFLAVVFDAFRTRDDVPMRQLDVVDTVCPLHSNYLVPPVDPPLPGQLRGLDWESLSKPELVRIASVIASTSQNPQATTFVNKILRQFDSELHVPKLARDVNPANRGFYGKATIEPKDNARPMVRKPFRTLGEREEALRGIIDNYLDRGWIRPSQSEWAAQAFVVPKPESADHQKR